MSELNGAEALVASLASEGVEVVFGLPGVQVMDILDAMYRQPGIRWVTVRHEQTAAFMAYGYARTTGKVGVAVVVPGPGALNATAALGTAYAASTPVLLISGQIESYNLGQRRGALHEVDDQLDVFRPLTKWCHRVLNVAEIPDAIHQAMRHSREGRPRPVELEIPFDLLSTPADVVLTGPEPPPPAEVDIDRIRDAARLLAASRYPIIWAGGGVTSADAATELTRLAEQLNAPVITTPEGKGTIPEDHPLSLGTIYAGPNAAVPALSRADVVLVAGSRFISPRSPWQPQTGQNIIRIDIDTREISRHHKAHLEIAADARRALGSILRELPAGNKSAWQATELASLKSAVRNRLEKLIPVQLSILGVIHEELKGDGILVPGVTNLGYWAMSLYPALRPRSYLTTSYFGTLGFAFPTALGAKMGNRHRPVVALCGDGGFMYALPDLATAVNEGLNVVALVFVDGAYGTCLRIQQRRFEDRIMGTRLHNPDFARLAESFGARGIRLSGHEELRDGLRAALAEKRPTVVEVPVPNLSTPWEIPAGDGT